MNWFGLLEKEWPHRGVDGVISCSKLDRLFSCPASINFKNDEEAGFLARVGTVLHYLLLEHKGDLPFDIPDEWEDLYWWCKSILDRQEGEDYGNEIYHATAELTGTADMIKMSSDGSVCYIRDLKTGRIPVYPESKQLIGYAYLMSDMMFQAPSVYNVGIVQPLVWGNEVPAVEYSAEEAEGFGEEIKAQLKKRGYGASGYCQFCPVKGSCEGTKDIFGLFVK